MPDRYHLSSGHRFAQPGAGESRENGGRAMQTDRTEETPDVPQACPEGLPPSVQKQEMQYESDPFSGTLTAAIYPPGHGVHR